MASAAACEQWSAFWHKRMPILDWLPRYNVRRDLKHDVIAGFTVGVMLVPQEMSLAAMMGVPGQYGLYTAAIAPLIYPLFGSSRALSVANASEGSLLVGVMLRSADIQSLEERVATGILLTFFTGALMILPGLLHQGGLVSFFSRTSMHGYVMATTSLIVTSQIPPWLGISLSSSNLTMFTVIEIISTLPETNRNSLLLGIFSICVLYICKKLRAQLQQIADARKRTHGTAANSKIFATSSSDSTAPHGSVEETQESDEDMDEIINLQLHDSADVYMGKSKGSERASSSSSTDKVRLMQAQDDIISKQGSQLKSGTPTSSSFLATYLIERPRVLFLSMLLCDGSALLVCVLGILVGASLGEDNLKLTGAVHKGLPHPVFPPAALGDLIPWDRLQTVATNSIVIAVIFFMSSVATGSKIAIKDGYEISPNQELLGLGFANLGASFFQGMPSSAGMSRSAVNSQSAHTPLASMITAVLVILTILFLTGPLYYLPQAPLSAIILLSALTLIDFSEPKWLRQVRKHEFYVWAGSFVGTLCFGLLYGLVLSLMASLVEIMVRTKKPPVFIMGQLPDGSFAKMREFQDEADSTTGTGNYQFQTESEESMEPVEPVELPDLLVVRMEQDLYFGNARHLIHAIEKDLQVAKARGRILGAVIDGSRMNDVDATAIHLLKEYQLKLRARDQVLLFANLRHETEFSIVSGGLVSDQEETGSALETEGHSAASHRYRPSGGIACAVALLRK